MLPGLLVIGAGILTILGGLVSVGVAEVTGAIGTATGVVVVLVGIAIPALPARRQTFAFVTYALAVPMVIFSYAGFVVGLFLLLLGGTLAYVWVPPPPGHGSGR